MEETKFGRNLVWFDDFSGDALNTDYWNFDQTMYTENREYSDTPDCCRVENGELHLQVHRSKKEGCDYKLCRGLTTMNGMNFKYGYLEMRARVPYRHGAWPSFWMKSDTPFQKAKWMCETDIFEVFGNEKDVVCTVHSWEGDNHRVMPDSEGRENRAYTFQNFETLNQEYHTYGFLWDPNEMSFFVDGKKYCTIPINAQQTSANGETNGEMAHFHDFQYIIFNNEIFTTSSEWWGSRGYALTEDDPLPIDYYIDSVCLYQKEGEVLKLKSDIQAAKNIK